MNDEMRIIREFGNCAYYNETDTYAYWAIEALLRGGYKNPRLYSTQWQACCMLANFVLSGDEDWAERNALREKIRDFIEEEGDDDEQGRKEKAF